MRRIFLVLCLSALGLVGCGTGTGSMPSRTVNARQALTGSAEALEFDAPSVRHELFREVARTSALEVGRPTAGTPLFPIVDGDRRFAASVDATLDLLQAPDAGQPLQLVFSGRGGERWAEDRRASLEGLSEKEVAELVARTLISHWGLHPSGPVQVDRASGAPYAVAYVDGILRVNPSFLYMAAAPASTATSSL